MWLHIYNIKENIYEVIIPGDNSSFIFGWMKQSVMKEMINGFSNSQARWECVWSVVILDSEVCKCKDASI